MVYIVDNLINDKDWRVMNVKGIITLTSETYNEVSKARNSGYVCTKHRVIFTSKRAYKLHMYKDHGY